MSVNELCSKREREEGRESVARENESVQECACMRAHVCVWENIKKRSYESLDAH